MRAAHEGIGTYPRLSENPFGGADVLLSSGMRPAAERQLGIRETEAKSNSIFYQGERLERLGRAAKKGNQIRVAGGGPKASAGINHRDVNPMAGLHHGAPNHLDKAVATHFPAPDSNGPGAAGQRAAAVRA